MKAKMLFLLAISAAGFGLATIGLAETVEQQVEGLLMLLGFSMAMGASGITAEVAGLRADVRTRARLEEWTR